MKLLVQGWVNIPHSYAIVNCFQLIHLYKNFKEELEIFIEEREYFRSNWVKKLVYPEQYNCIIKNLKIWNGEAIDIIYSITYPYNITKYNSIPKCIFYTAEHAMLDHTYFSIDNGKFDNIDDIKNYLENNDSLFFTSPSIWSQKGLKNLGFPDTRNKIITHGVDTTIFKLNMNISTRNAIRKKYGVLEDDILLINIGAMTGNKGMIQILIVLNHIIKNGNKKFKLLLKGTGDLYQSQLFIEHYFQILRENNLFDNENDEDNLKANIIYLNDTLSYKRINDLFNSADLYISPYLAEGFNLTVLEALSSGLPVLVPETGSTKEYIDDLKTISSDYIITLTSSVSTDSEGRSQNNYKIDDLYNVLNRNIKKINDMKKSRYTNYNVLYDYINLNYSWNVVSKLLYNYLNEILVKSKNK